jgi:hypothetical protein
MTTATVSSTTKQCCGNSGCGATPLDRIASRFCCRRGAPRRIQSTVNRLRLCVHQLVPRSRDEPAIACEFFEPSLLRKLAPGKGQISDVQIAHHGAFGLNSTLSQAARQKPFAYCTFLFLSQLLWRAPKLSTCEGKCHRSSESRTF